MKGKIIVLEGTDSSGKATQSQLLLGFLQKKGIDAELYSFPRYKEFFGSLVGKYLAGDFGSKESLPPEFCALLYSLDRYQIKKEIEEKLAEGKILVMDRYIFANIAHQAAKFSDAKEQENFLCWIECLESRMPEADAVVFLNMPTAAAQKLMLGKDREKAYRKGVQKDLHESDSDYLERTRRVYELLAKKNNWIVVDCAENGFVKTKEEIHMGIIEKLRQKQILK